MIILGREFAVTGLRNMAAGRGVLIPASGPGEGEDGGPGGGDLPAAAGRGGSRSSSCPALVALWLVVVLALVSGIDYFRTLLAGGLPAGPAAGAARGGAARRNEKGPAEVAAQPGLAVAEVYRSSTWSPFMIASLL